MSNTNDQQVQTPTKLKVSKVISQLMYFWASFGVGMLSLRVFLLATSANLDTGFSNFVYRVSTDYLQPFRGLFPAEKVNDTGYLDISAIFAIIVYLFLSWAFKEFLDGLQHKIDRNRDWQRDAILRNQMSSDQTGVEVVRRTQTDSVQRSKF